MNISAKIKSLCKNKTAARLGQNFAWLSLLQIASYAFPLISMPYLARVIGVDGYGKIAFAAAVIVWLQTITNWGFQYTSTRDISRYRDDKEKVSRILSNTLWASTLIMVVCGLLLIILCLLIPKFQDNKLVLFMTFLMLPGHILFPEWFFQALERMKYITLLNILSRLIFTVSIFIFIQNSSQYWIQPLLTSLGYIFSGVIAAYYIFFRWRYRLLKPDMRSIWIALKSSSDVFINEIFPNFYNSLSVIILGFFWGPSANGILDVGTKFSSLGIQLNRVVSRTFFPLLSREIHYHKYLRYIQLSSAAFLALILTIFAPQIIDVFYTSNFADAAVAIRILGISIFFVALSNVYGTNYLIIQGCERQLRNATCLASIIGFVLAIPLVYKFSYIGAALTIGITRMLLGLIIYVQAYKLKKTTQ